MHGLHGLDGLHGWPAVGVACLALILDGIEPAVESQARHSRKEVNKTKLTRPVKLRLSLSLSLTHTDCLQREKSCRLHGLAGQPAIGVAFLAHIKPEGIEQEGDTKLALIKPWMASSKLGVPSAAHLHEAMLDVRKKKTKQTIVSCMLW